MFAGFQQFISTPFFEDEDEMRVANLINVVLLVSLVASTMFALLGLFTVMDTVLTLAISVVMIFAYLGLLYLLHRGYVKISGVLFVSILWLIISVVVFITGGVSGPAPVIYAAIIVLGGLILGGKAVVVLTLLTVLLELGILYAEVSGALPDLVEKVIPLTMWLTQSASFVVLGGALYVAVHSLSLALRRAQENERALLENNQQLEARTRELERWATQLQTATQVGRAAASVHDLDELLPQVTHLISDRFGFYHTGIFMVDDNGFAVLRASNSEPGQEMLAREHKLRVEKDSIVGYATSTGEPRVALDVGVDAVHFKNPLLPETRSELALPLKVGERVIGALDVQSRRESAFNDGDVTVLQSMADQ